MYLPAHFQESSASRIQGLLADHPLATVITAVGDLPQAEHLPLLLFAQEGKAGVLRGHVARGNALATLAVPAPALAVFQGPQGYISPSWYPSKAADGRVVPTWNYAVVHVRGQLRAVDDRAWLRTFLDTLTGQHEAALPSPWAMSDAPEEYLERMLGAVVGVELAIETVSAKFKLSQNQPAGNRAGVVEGLGARGLDALAGAVRESTRIDGR
jgi:transcriptional regulator